MRTLPRVSGRRGSGHLPPVWRPGPRRAQAQPHRPAGRRGWARRRACGARGSRDSAGCPGRPPGSVTCPGPHARRRGAAGDRPSPARPPSGTRTSPRACRPPATHAPPGAHAASHYTLTKYPCPSDKLQEVSAGPLHHSMGFRCMLECSV
jgi:hypothetical protein